MKEKELSNSLRNIALLERLTKRNHLYALQAKLQPMLFSGLWTDNFSILKTGIMLSSGMRWHTFFFVRKRGYTLHIDAPEGGTKMETEKVYAMPFAKIYPILVAKAVGKGRTQAEVDEIIGWQRPEIEAGLEWNAWRFRMLRKSAGGYRRAADEGDPLFGKLVDELAKGKAMEKIKRTNK